MLYCGGLRIPEFPMGYKYLSIYVSKHLLRDLVSLVSSKKSFLRLSERWLEKCGITIETHPLGCHFLFVFVILHVSESRATFVPVAKLV